MNISIIQPINKVQVIRRITIRNPRSVYRQKPRMFDILFTENDVYFEFRNNKTESEVVPVNDVIELIREAASDIEDMQLNKNAQGGTGTPPIIEV